MMKYVGGSQIERALNENFTERRNTLLQKRNIVVICDMPAFFCENPINFSYNHINKNSTELTSAEDLVPL